ncbi:MAG: hypothetical protein ACXV4A_13140 [Actinomycetes bacterium]
MLLLVVACSPPGAPADREGGATMSCVSPRVSVDLAVAGSGDTVRATGDWFSATCNDAGTDPGQSAHNRPLTHLTLQVNQNGRSWVVAEHINAQGEHNSIDVLFPLSDLHPGSAAVTVDHHGRLVTIRIR